MATSTLRTSGSIIPSPFTGAWTSAAFTPSNNSYLVVFGFVIDNGGGNIAANQTLTGGGLTYTKRLTTGRAGGFMAQGAVWTAPVTTGVSTTLTFDCGASAVAAAMWFAYEVTGYNTVTPVGASVSNAATFPIDGAASLTLSAAPLSNSIVLAAFGLDGNTSGSIAVTPGATWTEDGEVGDVIVAEYGQAQHRTASTSTTVDWIDVRAGTMSTFSGCGIAIEIRAVGILPVPYYYSLLNS